VLKENIIQFGGTSSRAASNAGRLSPAKLRDARVAKRMTQTELAALVSVTRQAISAFEQGERTPEADTMTRIAKELEQPLAYFVTDDLPVFGESSVRFFRAVGPTTKRRNLASDVLGEWLVKTARYFDDFVNYPKLDLAASAPSSPDGRYSPDEIESAAEGCRQAWGLGLGPISDVVALLENKGIIVSRYVMDGETVEAFSYWSGNKPFILLASQKDSACRARFDAAHELGHLILHRWIGPEELEDPKKLKRIEAEANRFAGAFLLPQKSFPVEVYTTRLDAFVALKSRWKVAVQAMAYRCHDLGIIDDDQFTNLYKQISARRWRTREPLDESIPLEAPKVLRRAAELVLSNGRRDVDLLCNELQINRSDVEQFCGLVPGALASPLAPEEFRPTLK
jgi:Zn-dependent peptidase ImmA (M78 family)/transcriptional regulator with XRE-family HTH domain